MERTTKSFTVSFIRTFMVLTDIIETVCSLGQALEHWWTTSYYCKVWTLIAEAFFHKGIVLHLNLIGAISLAT